ncbi:l-asparaginase [Fusarium sporotrichioides]|uniref:L-asparaginase n=1 Tax=Fusarium sporotrichioides TaxID=5514 RepID=A0A395SRG8_FUSSP|nr:l-asparaginase [Fusarium sporotrichioides]
MAEPPKVKPRLVIHGGAGNIHHDTYPPEKFQAYRKALVDIVTRTDQYMKRQDEAASEKSPRKFPSALETATYAVRLLEDSPLFNSGHGAVFTRDGFNELEASVMVSRGHKKRGVGVMGLRHVRNPILLARVILEHGEDDLELQSQYVSSGRLDVPSAQGHAQLHGEAAEQLAEQYGLELVDQSYFYTQHRWDEHIRGLEREETGQGQATWSVDEYVSQGTCGAVALDHDGVICAATSTGGLTNKLTGRIGDTPTIGAGFWAEEWTEDGDPTGPSTWDRLKDTVNQSGPCILLSNALRGALADFLPAPAMYTPFGAGTYTTRSFGGSGTGNGDSFLRTNAMRTVAAIARWKPELGAKAVSRVAGRGGELQKSAGNRWQRTGEGQGGIIGIESVVVRDASGHVVETRSEILMDFNCGGMFRAWIDAKGNPQVRIFVNEL